MSDILFKTWHIEGQTYDRAGNRKEWRLTGRPQFCDDAMVERRLRARHAARFGVTEGVLTHWVWAETVKQAA